MTRRSDRRSKAAVSCVSPRPAGSSPRCPYETVLSSTLLLDFWPSDIRRSNASQHLRFSLSATLRSRALETKPSSMHPTCARMTSRVIGLMGQELPEDVVSLLLQSFGVLHHHLLAVLVQRTAQKRMRFQHAAQFVRHDNILPLLPRRECVLSGITRQAFNRNNGDCR